MGGWGMGGCGGWRGGEGVGVGWGGVVDLLLLLLHIRTGTQAKNSAAKTFNNF